MSGTTLCPHCETRFKIADDQLEAHHGMVRCGQCMQAFDALEGYVSDQPHPQLELPIMGGSDALSSAEPEAKPVPEPEPAVEVLTTQTSAILEQISSVAQPEMTVTDSSPTADTQTAKPHLLPAKEQLTLAEQVAILHEADEQPVPVPPKKHFPWRWASAFLILLWLAQAAYFFRVDLAARLPGLKPALVDFCHVLGCSVPLPKKTNLMSIESTELEANPEHENQITLNALLRNRATFAQAYPNLELTLNDIQDKPMVRRIFKPADYLPPLESEQIGLLSNHELSVKLYLKIADFTPTGYRLALFYP